MFCFLLGGVVGFLSAEDNYSEIQLALNGQSNYRIVIPDVSSAVQRTAASELQTYIKHVTDVELPIISESSVSFDNQSAIAQAQLFIIGPSILSKKALGNVDESAIGYDGIILKSVGKSIVLSGHPLRGPIYSVYEFLEKKLGCKWWTSTESTIPHFSELSMKNDLNTFYVPKLEYRESYYRDSFNVPFAVRLRCNGNGENIPEDFGSHHSFQYFVHSSYNLIPPQKYFLEHPDWFSEIDGVRKVGIPKWVGQSEDYKEFLKRLKQEQIYESGTQLCFSNDEMISEMIKNAREALKKNPHASFISISQNDWRGYCTCKQCRTIDNEEGSHAASLLRGVNKVAEALEKDFPNLYIETLAYQYTRTPPKITKPRKNVVIRLCSIECSFGQPLSSDVNRKFSEDLIGWSKIADKLFVWDYVTDFAFYLLPFPNYRVLAPNINFYLNHNVVGLFEQGDYQTETGDFVQLRNWVISKLLWDPSLDPNELIDEFLAGYYAPELVQIYRKYFDILSDAVERKNYYLSIYKTNTSEWLDCDSLNQLTSIQKNAEEIAQKLETEAPQKFRGLISKVRRERIPLDIVWLQEYRRMRLESKYNGTPFMGPPDPLQAARELCDKFNEFGLTRRREGETLEAFNLYKKDLIAQFEGYKVDSQYIPDFCKNFDEKNWIVLQESELNRFKLGEFTFTIDDSNASNGRAVKMPGFHHEWSTSWSVSNLLEFLSPLKNVSSGNPLFHVYVCVRCEASVSDGEAMTVGVYDERERKNVSFKSISVPDIQGATYKVVDLGVLPLTKTMYVWFAPPQRPNEVDAVFIDNIIIVREE